MRDMCIDEGDRQSPVRKGGRWKRVCERERSGSGRGGVSEERGSESGCRISGTPPPNLTRLDPVGTT
jgi:hypothetical protein